MREIKKNTKRKLIGCEAFRDSLVINDENIDNHKYIEYIGEILVNIMTQNFFILKILIILFMVLYLSYISLIYKIDYKTIKINF